MARYHSTETAWPCCPLTLPYEVTVPRPSYFTGDYTGVVVPSRVIPCFYNTVIEKPSPKENRKFFLDRSVFDLVEDHHYLALTDQKLLGWYLGLSPEDRKIIQDDGGLYQFLQRHPALELSRHHVYVKYNTGVNSPAQPTITSNKHTSGTSGAKKYRCDMPHRNLELEEMIPNKLRENLALLGCSNSRGQSQKQPHEEICPKKQIVHLQDGFQTASNCPITESHQKTHKDLAAMASFSLDVELERCRQRGKPELRSQISMAQVQSSNFTCAEISQLQSEWSTIEKESPSKYYSLDSIRMDGTEYYDKSVVQSGEPEKDDSVLAFKGISSTREIPVQPVEDNCSNKGCQNYMVYGSEYTVDDDQASSSFEDQSDNFHSIMEEDQSILACLPREGQNAPASGVHSGPLTANSEAPVASSETLKADQSLMKMNTVETYISPMPCVPTCDVMVGTELTECVLAFTQTEDPATADKHVITEVHMADLDYLAEEFTKLKTAQEKPTEQKEKTKSHGCKLRKECDCIQRAQQAELCLLALQYSMCRQHCWRLFYTSAEGGQLPPMHGDMNLYWPKDPPANIVTVLQNLECDYNQMRDKILAGFPLEQLKPLSVDSEKIIKGASYIPAQIIGDVLGNAPSWNSQQTWKHKTPSEGSGYSDGENNNGCQDGQQKQNSANQLIKDSCKSRRAVTLVPQERGATYNAHKTEEKQTSACEELNMSEAWYDAEEDLEPAAAAEISEESKDKRDESASEETKSSILCVSNLPSNVTESDVMLWFEKYHASEVSISTLKNDLRVAIVMVSGHQSAEGAVTDLNGCSMQGHTLHVEHINRVTAGSQGQASASISEPESLQDPTKPQTSKTDSSSTERQLITQPPLSSSLKNRKVVCISPTAKGTCVPQHYGTMGSFDTLMAQLTQRHPDIGRQRIVDALIELRTKHQGILCGLPLRTIREMTSDLLTRPASATQL
ncbi:RNA-binding protein 44 isoform X2 [Thunnus albacares]|uniref:RNA-binding protein 44 isoform X2 n=1 Tax=Thunnus albacares TaxID=8236 RepID=UPI001CF6FFA8|nr:RNA-binding protein 44 isoform X2 [Thunnus albacares]